MDFVELCPHTLRLRPREGHEQRIESSKLEIFPSASLRWHRDVEGNSVSLASFSEKTKALTINSDIVIQQYDLAPLDFLVADYAVNFPFTYQPDEQVLLAPYLSLNRYPEAHRVTTWIKSIYPHGQPIQSVAMLLKINQAIYKKINYARREEEGVQSAEQTLSLCSGSCRDFANLFIVIARELGFAARFVSGYIYSESSLPQATHAWMEVFIPGAGWKGFDPTMGMIAGSNHIAVAVARKPESVPPVAGTFLGPPGASMDVHVWVSDIT